MLLKQFQNFVILIYLGKNRTGFLNVFFNKINKNNQNLSKVRLLAKFESPFRLNFTYTWV